jgi:hypothetical protein
MINLYEEFQDWVEKNCMYEAFYKDSEGRTILVIRELDAWVMCNKFAELVAAAEREACADIAENWRCNGMPRTVLADQIRARGQA